MAADQLLTRMPSPSGPSNIRQAAIGQRACARCGRPLDRYNDGGLALSADTAGNADRPDGRYCPTLLRVLITERHWQRFGTFEAQFRRAARELAERESDPDVAKLTVSSRQWERWYSGSVKTEPHPDACRVLEHLFGYPIRQLLGPADVSDKLSAESPIRVARKRRLDRYSLIIALANALDVLPGELAPGLERAID